MTNGPWTEAMKEHFEELQRALSKQIDVRFDEAERRLGDSLSKEIVRQLETAEKHLSDQMQVYAEDLKDLVKKAAEGYAGTLEGVQGRLEVLEKR